MTANQINYARLLEDQRHNREGERQRDEEIVHLGRQAGAAEQQAQAALSRVTEEQRANREREKANWYNAFETNRSNVAQEAIKYRQIEESERRGAAETLHWQRTDDISARNAESQRISALGASMRGQAALSQVAESQRANRVAEQQRDYQNATDRQRMLDTYSLGLREYGVHSQQADTAAKRQAADAYKGTQDIYIGKRNADTNRISAYTGLAGSIIRGLS